MTVKSFIIYPFLSLEFCLETIPTWQNPPFLYLSEARPYYPHFWHHSHSPGVLKDGRTLFSAIPLKDLPRMLECNSSKTENLNSLWSKALVSDLSTHLTFSNLSKVFCYPSRSSCHSKKEARANEKFRNFFFSVIHAHMPRNGLLSRPLPQESKTLLQQTKEVVGFWLYLNRSQLLS